MGKSATSPPFTVRDNSQCHTLQGHWDSRTSGLKAESAWSFDRKDRAGSERLL